MQSWFDSSSTTQHPYPVMYIECDIPDGMTLVEWRRRRQKPPGRAGATWRAIRHLTRRGLRSIL
jgi:hypothetical protein